MNMAVRLEQINRDRALLENERSGEGPKPRNIGTIPQLALFMRSKCFSCTAPRALNAQICELRDFLSVRPIGQIAKVEKQVKSHQT